MDLSTEQMWTIKRRERKSWAGQEWGGSGCVGGRRGVEQKCIDNHIGDLEFPSLSICNFILTL